MPDQTGRCQAYAAARHQILFADAKLDTTADHNSSSIGSGIGHWFGGLFALVLCCCVAHGRRRVVSPAVDGRKPKTIRINTRPISGGRVFGWPGRIDSGLGGGPGVGSEQKEREEEPLLSDNGK